MRTLSHVAQVSDTEQGTYSEETRTDEQDTGGRLITHLF